MKPALHTDEQIIEAGKALLAMGEEVNGWKLRVQLGSRGKPERLQQVWDQFCSRESIQLSAELPAQLKVGIDAILASVGKQLTSMFAELHKEVTDQAASVVETSELRLKDALASFEREKAAASAELERLESVIQDLEEQLNESTVRVEAAEQKVVSSNLELTRSVEQLSTLKASLQQAVADGAVLKTRNDELQRITNDQAVKISGLSQQVEDLQKFASRLDGELSTSRSAEHAALTRESLLAGELNSAKKQLEAEGLSVQELRKSVAQTSESLTQANVLLQVAQARETTLLGEAAATAKRVDDLEKKILSLSGKGAKG